MQEDNKRTFWSTLKAEWYPSLRELRFSGSGKHFIRVRDSLVDCVALQTRSDGSSCCVNLGLHPRGLPAPFGGGVVEAKMKVVDCEFKRRLAPEGQVDHWWPFGNTQSEAASAARDLAALFASRGEPCFRKYESIRDLVGDATPDDISKGTVPLFADFPITALRAALLLAQLRKSQGDVEAAHAFAQFGLDQTTAVKGAALRGYFKELLKSS